MAGAAPGSHVGHVSMPTCRSGVAALIAPSRYSLREPKPLVKRSYFEGRSAPPGCGWRLGGAAACLAAPAASFAVF